MTIHFTSDQHFWHQNIIKYCNRPFSTVEEMNETLIQQWNNKVNPQDTVYFLGDFGFAHQEKLRSILERLNGNIHLIKGNHDRPLNGLHKYFTSVQDYKVINVPDETIQGGLRPVVMLHYPLLSWERMRYGSIHLHGHSHGSIPSDFKLRRIDVGVDCWDFYPVSFEEIISKINETNK